MSDAYSKAIAYAFSPHFCLGRFADAIASLHEDIQAPGKSDRALQLKGFCNQVEAN